MYFNILYTNLFNLRFIDIFFFLPHNMTNQGFELYFL